jgi:hypothetical protein
MPRGKEWAMLLGQVVMLAACTAASPSPADSNGPASPVARDSIQPIQVVPGRLSIRDCGWPADTPIAFQGWATEADLGMMVDDPTQERLYWLITAERVELMTSQGSGMVRVACSVDHEGHRGYRVVPDDWRPPGSE